MGFRNLFIVLLLFSIQLFAFDFYSLMPLSNAKSLPELPAALTYYNRPEVQCRNNKCGIAEATVKQISSTVGQVMTYDRSKINVSIVTAEEADALFYEIKNQPDIPFKFPKEGCYARADQMAILLEKRGIIVGKIYAQGELRFVTKLTIFGWRYHVAPFLLVDLGSSLQIRIIDPSMFDYPTTVSEWVKNMTSYDDDDLVLKSVRYANRFNWEPPINNKLQDYPEGQIENSLKYSAKYLAEQHKMLQSIQ